MGQGEKEEADADVGAVPSKEDVAKDVKSDKEESKREQSINEDS